MKNTDKDCIFIQLICVNPVHLRLNSLNLYSIPPALGAKPRTRRHHLLALGADPDKVHMATRSRKGYWRTCPAIASGDGG